MCSASRLVAGLTGGIGAGKSLVSARLAEHGAIIIDADQLARQVVARGTSGFAAVVEALGATVIGQDGELDRTMVGSLIFADEGARRRVEEIIHPRVRARTEQITAQAPPGSVIVNDIPLLVESGLHDSFDLVIVVQATIQTRVHRLTHDRGMSEAEAYARIHAQTSDECRRAVADIVINNDGTREELLEQVDALWHNRLAPTPVSEPAV